MRECLVILYHWICYIFGRSFMQGELLTGRPENVREFDSCLGNVEKLSKRWRNLVTVLIAGVVFGAMPLFSSIMHAYLSCQVWRG